MKHWLGAGALLAQTIEELRKLAEQDGQPAYRGKQLHDGLMRGAQTLDDFSNVSPSPYSLTWQPVPSPLKPWKSCMPRDRPSSRFFQIFASTQKGGHSPAFRFQAFEMAGYDQIPDA